MVSAQADTWPQAPESRFQPHTFADSCTLDLHQALQP